MRVPGAPRILAGGLALAVLACTDSPSRSAAAVERWSLAPTPQISIGVADGDDRYMFRRITGALILSGGRVLIADVEPTLAIYDSAGQFVRSVGRQGSGPGEFRYLFSSPVRYRGDSIGVWDMGSGRASLFDDTGAFGRSVTISTSTRWPAGTIPEQSCCALRATLPDGAFVLELPATIPNEPGPDRYSTTTLMRVSADGTPGDTIGAYASSEYRYDASKPNAIDGMGLGSRFTYALIGDTLIGGNGDGPWLLRTVVGVRTDTVPLPVQPVPVTPEIRQAFGDAYRAEFARRPERFEGTVDDVIDGAYAKQLPTYTRVHSDGAGRLWLAQWQQPFGGDSLGYDVYSTSGKPIARIAIPAGARIADIRDDRVALIVRDSLDVESVRIYAVVRRRRP